MSTPRLQLLHSEIGQKLGNIADLLPSEYKLTLIARNPDNDQAHIVMGDDVDTEAIVYVLQHPELTPIETK
jgi:hypothetical protein